MKLLLTGATGAIGTPAVAQLVAAGHEVRGIARDEHKASQLSAAGAEPVRADVFDAAAVGRAVAGVDGILHLATNVPPMAKMALSSAWRTHNRLRTQATKLLIDAARAHDVSLFVKESITYTYPDCGDRWIDETVTPLEDVKLLRPALEGERMVARFGADGGRGVVLRFGAFYGPTARGTDEALRVARMHVSPVPGDPEGYVSSIHVDDAAAAVVAVLDAPAGVYNCVDDEPLTRREYADAFAAAFDLPHLRIPPAGVMRAVGGSASRAITASQRVSNARLRGAADWAPAYPSVREGWASIAAARAHNEGAQR